MSERQTVEAIAERALAEFHSGALAKMRKKLPPGYVIAPAGDVVTDELRAALRKALIDLETGYRLMPGSMSWEADHEDVAVIERWLEAEK